MVAQIDEEYKKIHFPKVLVRLISYAFFEGRPVTTKGQWINPIVFSHFWIEKKIPKIKDVKSPIYVIGTGRSGTTILGVVLSVHQDIGFLNEPKAMWNSIYSQEDVIGSYERGRALYRLNEKNVNKKVKQAAHKLYAAYAFAVRRARVVDKYPEMIFRVPFVLDIFPDAKFIFLTRNGWDACASITNWSKRKGTQVKDETHDWWGVNRRKWNLMVEQLIKPDPALKGIHDLVDSLDHYQVMAAVEWVVTMREGMEVARRYPDSVITVCYEDFVKDPAGKLTEIFDFCNLPHDQQCVDYAKKVLKHVKPYNKFPMPEALQHIFDKTMKELNYTSE